MNKKWLMSNNWKQFKETKKKKKETKFVQPKY